MKYKLALLVIIFGFLTFMSYGCTTGLNVHSPFSRGLVSATPKAAPVDQIRASFDLMCPKPTVPDTRGDMASGFFDAFTKNSINSDFTPDEIAAIADLKRVCAKSDAQRTDYEIGSVGGNFARVILARLNTMGVLGRDVLTFLSFFGISGI
jgi:hypothetical protein